jgi:hypothetical protein
VSLDIREDAIRATMRVLSRATDWQEGQTFLGQDDRFGPWLDEESGGDGMEAISLAQGIVREAEERLGEELPY